MAVAPALLGVPFVAVDVETTGLDPRHDQIVEIGAVRVQGGELQEEFATLVSVDITIPFEARRVHGIGNEMLVGKPRIREALDLFLAFAGDGVLVEHSWKAFDVAFLERAHGAPLTARYLNTCTLSRKLFPFFPKHSLEECCRRHGIAVTRAHRALDDARATAQLLLYLLNACAPQYPLLDDLIRIASIERDGDLPGGQRRSHRVSGRRRRLG